MEHEITYYPTLVFNGSIAVGIEYTDTREPVITFSKMYEKHIPGEELTGNEPREPIQAMKFETTESIDVIIKGLNYLKYIKNRRYDFEHLLQYNCVSVEA